MDVGIINSLAAEDEGSFGRVKKVNNLQPDENGNVATLATDEEYTTGTATDKSPTVAQVQNRITDAPEDDKQYARLNGEWAEVIAGSGDITSSNDTVNDIVYMTEEEYEAKLASGELLPGQIISTIGSATSSGIPDAPVDGKQYARQDANWTEVIGGSSGAELATDEEYETGTITTKAPNVKQVKDTFNNLDTVPEAPVDGKQYARQDETWAEITSGGSGAELATDEEYNAGTITTKAPTVKQVTDTFNDLGSVSEAPEDGQGYIRKDKTWELLSDNFILTSPNGTKYYIRVSNTGEMTSELVDSLVKHIAHRGRSGLSCDDNTIEALEVSGALGFWGMEVDVRETSDGHFVLAHDASVQFKSTNLTIANSTLTQIQSQYLYPSGSSYATNSVQYVAIRMPTLQQYLAVCKKYNSVPVIEIKQLASYARMSALQDIVEAEVGNNYVIIAFDIEYCKQARNNNTECGVQYLMSSIPDTATLDELQTLNIDLDLSYGFVNYDLITDIKARGLEINAWTVNDTSTLTNLTKEGINYITTDYFRDPTLFADAKPNMTVQFEDGEYGQNQPQTTATSGQATSNQTRAHGQPFSILGYSHVRRTDSTSAYTATCSCFDASERQTMVTDIGWLPGSNWVELPANAATGYIYVGKSSSFTTTELASLPVTLEFANFLGY